MDLATVLPVLISGAVSLAVCIINNNFQSNKQKAENEKQIALIQYQIQELKNEVEKSNNVKERVTKIEGMALLWDEKLRGLNDRMKVVESENGHGKSADQDDGK